MSDHDGTNMSEVVPPKDIDVLLDDGEVDVNLEILGALFGPHTRERVVLRLPNDADVFDVLVAAGLFASKGQAKKNWKGRPLTKNGVAFVTCARSIPFGMSYLGPVGKNGHDLTIWRPRGKDLVSYRRARKAGLCDR